MITENVYPFDIGDFKLAAVSDGDLGYSAPANVLFSNAQPETLEETLRVYNETGFDIKPSWTCLVIDTGNHRVLVDTGGGNFYGPNGGKLLENLISGGFEPSTIDTVILSHEHGDHIGGAMDAVGKPKFVNARYLMGKEEWDFLAKENYFIQKQCYPLLKNHIEWIDREGEILPGIRAIFAPGHTSHGYLVLEISSKGDKLLYLGDIFLHPIHIEHPDWFSNVIDSDPERLMDTRRRFLKQAGAEKIIVHLYHFDFPGLGYFITKGNEWQWQSVEKLY